jgi:hypothetical protein
MPTHAVARKVRELQAEERKVARAAKREKVEALISRAELEVKQATERDKAAENARLMSEADAKVRESAPTLEIRYRNIVLPASPERCPDMTMRLTAYTSFQPRPRMISKSGVALLVLAPWPSRRAGMPGRRA